MQLDEGLELPVAEEFRAADEDVESELDLVLVDPTSRSRERVEALFEARKFRDCLARKPGNVVT
jgi:hypothetical protein